MKKCTSFLLAFSLLFLVLGVASIDDIQRKTLFTAAGIVFGAAGVIFAALSHGKKWNWLAAGGLVIGYGLYLILGFHTADLGDFFPDGWAVESVDLISAETNERILWTPGGGEPTLSDASGRPVLSGGSAEGMALNAKDIVLRDYWRPGAMESSKVSEISVYFTNGESSGRLSLYQDGGAEYSIAEPSQDGGRQWSRWLLFGDLTDILPQEVIALLP